MGPHACRASSEGQPSPHPTGIITRLIAFGTALLLLPLSLSAQQAPYSSGSQQPYPYNNQYDPSQQQQPPNSYNNQYDPGQQYAAPSQSYDQSGDAQPPSGYPQSGYQQAQGLSSDQLEQLVAPIALDPDSLVSVILAASTYPQQVADADRWRQAQGNASPDQIAYGAGLQNWDQSVKALTAFPQILAEMDQNIQWTAALGNAYYNQPQDVLQSIQIMRDRAQSAGNLQSTPQQTVDSDQGYIQIAPSNPQVVYVPAYNPWTVYGQPVAPYPGFSLLGAFGSVFNSSFGSSAVQFGLGMVMSAFSHTPFGLLSWGLDWLAHSLLFHNSSYYSHSTTVADWGLPYGGRRAWMAPHRSLAAYNRSGYGSAYNRGYNQSLIRSQYRYPGNSSRENYNRGYQNRYQTSQYNYSRAQQPYSRTNYQSNYNGSYRTGLYNRPQSAYAHSSVYESKTYASNYGNTGYRAPYSGFNQRYSSPGMSNSFMASSRESSRSGGFFGGNRNSGSFGHEQSFKQPSFKEPSFKAPKYKAPKEFGGGHHSFGGGHSSGGHHSGGHHH